MFAHTGGCAAKLVGISLAKKSQTHTQNSASNLNLNFCCLLSVWALGC
jgi:hypothetical protein